MAIGSPVQVKSCQSNSSVSSRYFERSKSDEVGHLVAHFVLWELLWGMVLCLSVIRFPPNSAIKAVKARVIIIHHVKMLKQEGQKLALAVFLSTAQA